MSLNRKKYFLAVSTLFIIYSAGRGILFGTVNFGEVIARKDLGASEFTITMLTMLMPVVSLSSIWWGRMLEGRDQRLLLTVFGFIGFGSLITGFWMNSINHLFTISLIYWIVFALFTPAQNRVLQQHIHPGKQGIVFGWAQAMRMGVAAIISLGGGHWMDNHVNGFQHLYGLAGIAGIVSMFFLVAIPPGKQNNNHRTEKDWLLGPLKEAGILLKRRGDFLRFELVFMLYGLAFMMLLPVIPVFLVDDLKLDYATIGLARGTVTQLIMVVSIPLFGKIFDRSTPYHVSALVFIMLALHPLFLILAGVFDSTLSLVMLYASYTIYGIAFGGINIVWGISSLRFAGEDEDAGVYQSIHLAAVGIRGLFGPLAGYIAMNLFGRLPTMGIASFLFLTGGLLMIYLNHKDGGKKRSTW